MYALRNPLEVDCSVWVLQGSSSWLCQWNRAPVRLNLSWRVEQSVATGCLSVTGNVLHSVRARAVHSKALKCSFNFKRVSKWIQVKSAELLVFKINFMLTRSADKGHHYECQRNLSRCWGTSPVLTPVCTWGWGITEGWKAEISWEWVWREDGCAPEDIKNIPGISWTVFFCQDFTVQLCRGSSESDISVVVAGGPRAVSIGTWKWKGKSWNILEELSSLFISSSFYAPFHQVYSPALTKQYKKGNICGYIAAFYSLCKNSSILSGDKIHLRALCKSPSYPRNPLGSQSFRSSLIVPLAHFPLLHGDTVPRVGWDVMAQCWRSLWKLFPRTEEAPAEFPGLKIRQEASSCTVLLWPVPIEVSEFSNILFSLLLRRKEVVLSTFLPDLPEWDTAWCASDVGAGLIYQGNNPVPVPKEIADRIS